MQFWVLLSFVYLSSLQAAAQQHRKDEAPVDIDKLGSNQNAKIFGAIAGISPLYAASSAASGATVDQVKAQLPSSQLELDSLPPAEYLRSLYPSAFRIKRGAYSLINPTFQRSEEDVGLLFEILLAGMQIRGEEDTLLIPDEELASLRSVKKLEVICEDVLPKTLSDIRRLMADLVQQQKPLSWQDFERTVLTLVYTSQTLAQITNRHQRELWTNTLIQLFQAVQKDLKPS